MISVALAHRLRSRVHRLLSAWRADTVQSRAFPLPEALIFTLDAVLARGCCRDWFRAGSFLLLIH